MALPATRPTAATAGAVLSTDQCSRSTTSCDLRGRWKSAWSPLSADQGHRGLFRSLARRRVGRTAYALERGRNKDILSPLIRNLGSLLVMGAQPLEILRQYMAKADSPTRGRELNVHFNDLEKGYLGQSPTSVT